MSYILDTHVILHAALEPEKLSDRVHDILSSQENELVISAASIWEIAIKVSINKLPLPMDLKAFIHTTVSRLNAAVIPITMDETLELAQLPLHHKDPFDRILIAQGRNRAIPIITKDSSFAEYPVETIW
jgi:PIN domain nuclease of toxin-antitoxin system